MTTKTVDSGFLEAWAKKEVEGYRYGHDALEQVRLGWDMAMARDEARIRDEPMKGRIVDSDDLTDEERRRDAEQVAGELLLDQLDAEDDRQDALPLESVRLAFAKFLDGRIPPKPMSGLSEQAAVWSCKWVIGESEFEIGVSLDSSPNEQWWWTMKNVPRGSMRGDILHGPSLMTALLWMSRIKARIGERS